jgi:hypothetical protein
MQKIPLTLASPGMKLAKPVTNKRGMPLCGAGTELTEALLARLSDVGIQQIVVEGHPVDMGEDEATLDQQIDELHARFTQVQSNPLMMKIRDILLERLQQKSGKA